MNKIYFLALVIDNGILLTTAHKSLESALNKFTERKNDSKIKNSSILWVEIETGVASWIYDLEKALTEKE